MSRCSVPSYNQAKQKNSECGAVKVEYALKCALIIIAAITAVQSFGFTQKDKIENFAYQIDLATSGQTNLNFSAPSGTSDFGVSFNGGDQNRPPSDFRPDGDDYALSDLGGGTQGIGIDETTSPGDLGGNSQQNNSDTGNGPSNNNEPSGENAFGGMPVNY